MDTFSRVAELLSKRSIDFSMINYPEKREKSIDIIAINKNNKGRIVVKILKTKKVSKIKSDLQNLARVGVGIPVMINDYTEEEVINDKGNVLEMSTETFEKILDGEKIFLYKTRGGMFVKINSKELRKKREEMGLSLGEVAQTLGVSRISIYEYEKEDPYVSIDIAEKLVEIFGEEILGDVLTNFRPYNMTTEVESSPNKIFPSKLLDKLSEKGYKIVNMNFTAIDIIASKEESKEEKRVFFSIETESTSKSLIKFNEARKISEKTKSELIIIVKDAKNKKTYEKEDFNTLSENEIMNYEFD